MEYQVQGIIEGHDSKALAKANKQIITAKLATPGCMHKLFRASIVHQSRGYYFGWILK